MCIKTQLSMVWYQSHIGTLGAQQRGLKEQCHRRQFE